MTTLPTSALMIHFKDYEQFHQTKGNKACHWFGIPGVTFSLLGLLSYVVIWTPFPDSWIENLIRIDLGLLIWIIGSAFAFKVDKKLSIPYTLFTYLLYLTARHVPLNVLVVIQIISWGFQLYGHYHFEKKSPAFLSSISSIFIGPMWIFARMIGYYHP